jgi:arginine deiminase
MERQFGVHSEVGKLRTVLVCCPGLAHQRVTPGNCRDLLFDDVLWVHEARKDHFDFVLKMRERGIEVLELHELLGQTLARHLDRRIIPNSGGRVTAMAIRSWLDAMPAAALAAEATGKKAAIGALKDLKSILQGEAGTTISTASSGILWSQ